MSTYDNEPAMIRRPSGVHFKRDQKLENENKQKKESI